MRTYKTQIVQSKREVVTGIFCDWCGTRIGGLDRFETRDFTLQFTEGNSYPDGGSKDGWEVEDLCNKCVAKLRTLLVANGISISGVEIDW